MDRLTALTGLAALLLLASCQPSAPTAKADHPGWWGADWTSAWFYDDSRLTEAERARLPLLEPAGGEGRVGLTFTDDFDHDGTVETVHWGAYTKKGGEEGNFVLLERAGAEGTKVLLLQEFPGAPSPTAFTLKPDGSLWFGGGVDAGEVLYSVTWEAGQPVFHRLAME